MLAKTDLERVTIQSFNTIKKLWSRDCIVGFTNTAIKDIRRKYVVKIKNTDLEHNKSNR